MPQKSSNLANTLKIYTLHVFLYGKDYVQNNNEVLSLFFLSITKSSYETFLMFCFNPLKQNIWEVSYKVFMRLCNKRKFWLQYHSFTFLYSWWLVFYPEAFPFEGYYDKLFYKRRGKSQDQSKSQFAEVKSKLLVTCLGAYKNTLTKGG